MKNLKEVAENKKKREDKELVCRFCKIMHTIEDEKQQCDTCENKKEIKNEKI